MGSLHTLNSVSRERAIQWCQLSISARAMSWSVFRNALAGRLAMTLPEGQVRLVLHGVRKGDDLFVTQAALSYVVVSAEDSLTGQREEYVFHAGADHSRQRYASVEGLFISARDDGQYQVSDVEWALIEPEMQRGQWTQRYPYRKVMDLIVLKIGSGSSWTSLSDDPKLVNAVKAAFRQWSRDGRLGIALEVLTAERCAGEGGMGLGSASAACAWPNQRDKVYARTHNRGFLGRSIGRAYTKYAQDAVRAMRTRDFSY